MADETRAASDDAPDSARRPTRHTDRRDPPALGLSGPLDDHFHDECGVFGVWNVPDAAAVTALGLHALQHRGQESAGIVTFDKDKFHSHRGLGLVGDNFSDRAVIARLPGRTAIGHNRYATTGDTVLRNVQPLYADFEFGGLAVAHNGNLTNAHVLRRALVRRGCLFQSTTDSEVFIQLIAISLYSTIVDRLIDALKQVVGAWSLVALSNEALMGVRDPLGVRPLILGRIGSEGTGGWVLASETCALDIVGADFVRDVEPGEIVVINDQGVHSIRPFNKVRERFCVFEYIYFARPSSLMEGTSVYEARKRIGRELALESAIEADVIVPVPDSGVPAAMGYSTESGIPFELGDHPQPIHRPHLHRAHRPHPPSGREAEALGQPHRAEGQAGHPGRRLDRPRHHQQEDRRDGPRGWRERGPHADLLAAHDAFLLLRHRHAGTLATAGRQPRRGADGPIDRRRQLGVRVDRRTVPRSGQDRPQRRRAAVLRRVLHRRLSDPAAGSGRQRRPATQSARRNPLMPESGRPPLAGRVALVTGASRGLGAAVAIELARLGAHVVITARTQGGLEDTDDAVRSVGGTATLLTLDLREPERLEAVAPSVFARFGRLDILVHAAAVLGKLTPVGHATAEDRTEVLAVNTLAPWRLIQGCDAALRQSDAGRAVFVTDRCAAEPLAYWGPYGASKAAARNLVLTWAAEVGRITPVRVNLFDPGPMRTRLRAAAFPGEDPASMPPPAGAAAALCALCLPGEFRHGQVVRHR